MAYDLVYKWFDHLVENGKPPSPPSPLQASAGETSAGKPVVGDSAWKEYHLRKKYNLLL